MNLIFALVSIKNAKIGQTILEFNLNKFFFALNSIYYIWTEKQHAIYRIIFYKKEIAWFSKTKKKNIFKCPFIFLCTFFIFSSQNWMSK